MNMLFTIGHSNHPIERFIQLLRDHGVTVLADVRSSPYSQYAPQFTKAPLQAALQHAGFEYWFLGRELGARREEEGCYVDEQARYDRIAQLPIFRAGLNCVLDRMRHAAVALMCSEGDAATCHRSVLVCRELLRLRPGLSIAHIRPDGAIEPHEQLLERLIETHKLQPELFGELSTTDGLIDRAYDLQAARIAYKREPAQP